MAPEEFRALWTYTVQYLRETRGLRNLLFCYEVTENRGERLQGLVPEMTDILGIQCGRQPFTKTLELYEEYLPFGKPILMPQFLPMGKESEPYDNLAFVEAMKERHPLAVGFSPWFSNGKRHAIVSNPNAAALMHHPWIATLEDTGLANPTPPEELPVPRSLSAGTEKAAAGQFVWNFDGSDASAWSKGESIVAMAQSDGRLNVFYHGERPSILSPPNLGLDAGAFSLLRVRMRNHSTSTRAEIRWISADASTWNDGGMAEFAIRKNSLDYAEYTIDLSTNKNWRGAVGQIALSPAADSVTGSGEIDYFAVHPAP
ncbi:MAG: Glycosyl hydrolase family 26 [candidate division BRC1 bacterium ADurb.BinA364]|nr:MAG: Glycosyl hydrolase family 26 [candidate division BRC1 bacterium ADurb.BinA364]